MTNTILKKLGIGTRDVELECYYLTNKEMDKKINEMFKTLSIKGNIAPDETKERFYKRKCIELFTKLIEGAQGALTATNTYYNNDYEIQQNAAFNRAIDRANADGFYDDVDLQSYFNEEGYQL